jgi:hypothetical protein
MAARKLRFLKAVTNEYREKCPELSRIMMMKYFERLNGPNIEDFGDNFQWTSNACEHCGTIFTYRNCTFRIKPKRKRRKKCNVKNDRNLNIIPKSSNFLQILCHYCGWKTRQAGARRKTNNGSDQGDMVYQTPKLSGNAPVTPELSRIHKQSGSGLENSSGNKKKTKSRLKELLAKEKLASDQKTSSPSLINFLATI